MADDNSKITESKELYPNKTTTMDKSRSFHSIQNKTTFKTQEVNIIKIFIYY